jgi:hypothetical protein
MCTVSEAIGQVTLLGIVAKVAHLAIATVPIVVADIHAGRMWSDEGFGYETMDEAFDRLLSLLLKTDEPVPSTDRWRSRDEMPFWRHDAAIVYSPPATTDAAEIGNLVAVEIWDGSEFFAVGGERKLGMMVVGH